MTARCAVGPSERCQFRVAIKVSAPSTGWHEVLLSEQELLSIASRLTGFTYRPNAFSYSRAVLYEVNENDDEIPLSDSGYCLLTDDTSEQIPKGLHLAEQSNSESTDSADSSSDGYFGSTALGRHVAIPVHKDQLYHLRFRNSHGGRSPSYIYDPRYEQGSRLRISGFAVSYLPYRLPWKETDFDALIKPDATGPMMLFFDSPQLGRLHTLSLKKAKISLMVNFHHTGPHLLHLYYQTTGSSIYLPMPSRRMSVSSFSTSKIPCTIVSSCRFFPKQSGHLLTSKYGDIYCLPSTDKITPDMPLDLLPAEKISLSLARNESESFQVVIKPKSNFQITGITATLFNDGYSFPDDAISVSAVEYVPIRHSYMSSPWQFRGLIGDPLVPISKKSITCDDGNQAFLFTLRTTPSTPAGIYEGAIVIKSAQAGEITLPMRVRVFNFALPEYSPFISNVGLQHFTKGEQPLAAYCGARSADEVKVLSGKYFEAIGEYRLSPKNAALYTPLSFNWTEPPQGMDIDLENNFFQLYDWDFTQYNQALDHFIGRRKINQICIYHTSAKYCNVFSLLPGGPVQNGFNSSSPYATTQNQSFRKMNAVGYSLSPSHAYFGVARAITRGQFDQLILDYLRPIAQNLDSRGYLKFATILIDEGDDSDGFLRHFLSILKSDPLLRKIRVCGSVQTKNYYANRDNDGKYYFRDLVDIYLPDSDDSHDALDGYPENSYLCSSAREHFISYALSSSHFTIDAPGICTRILGLDIFRKGGCGLYVWEILSWNTGGASGRSTNPWIEPGGQCNGGTAFFYPPKYTQIAPKQTVFTITPSLRLSLLRDGVEDFEYAYILEKLIATAKEKQIPCARAEAILQRINALFDNSVSNSLNEQSLFALREEMAEEIESLQRNITSDMNP